MGGAGGGRVKQEAVGDRPPEFAPAVDPRPDTPGDDGPVFGAGSGVQTDGAPRYPMSQPTAQSGATVPAERLREGVSDRAPGEGAGHVISRASGRAGRNLPSAVGIGLALGGLIVVSLFPVRQLFAVVAVAAAILAVLEIAGALAGRDIIIPRLPVLSATVAMMAAALFGGAGALAVAFGLSVTVIVSWTLVAPVRRPGSPTGTGAGRRSEPDARDTAAAVFTIAYVPLLAAFACLLLRPGDGAWRVLTLILIVVCSDTGGFAAGVLWGRHPLAPRISPKKSWEGLGGSTVAAVAAAVVATTVFFDAAWWIGVLLGLVTVVVATLGDLGESMIKRDLGIKDMSSRLPGHGGLMDRMDSLLAAAPVVWLVLVFLVGPVARPWT